ncbi:MAG: NUDIX hydrolase [Anaerolineaceae bacterium]
MDRIIRYQGAIIRDDQLLLIQHHEHESGREYWILPGGGREAGESEEACVRREMLEETGLTVAIEHLLLDDVGARMGPYIHLKTYLCKIISGEAEPGYEPEPDAFQEYAITEVRWFDLKNPAEWEEQLEAGPVTQAVVRRIRTKLGYLKEIR